MTRLRDALGGLLLTGLCASSLACGHHRAAERSARGGRNELTREQKLRYNYVNVYDAVAALRSNWLRASSVRRWTRGLLIASLAALTLGTDCAPRAARSTNDGIAWVRTWTAAPQLTEPHNLPPAPGRAGGTLRQAIHVSVGGSRLRLRLSNAFGDAPLTIAAAHVARSTGGGAIDSTSGRVRPARLRGRAARRSRGAPALRRRAARRHRASGLAHDVVPAGGRSRRGHATAGGRAHGALVRDQRRRRAARAAERCRRRASGPVQLEVGASSADIRQTTTVQLVGGR